MRHVSLVGVGFPRNYLSKKWAFTEMDLARRQITGDIVDHLESTSAKEAEDKEVASRSEIWHLFGIFTDNVYGILYVGLTCVERIFVWGLIIEMIKRWWTHYKLKRSVKKCRRTTMVENEIAVNEVQNRDEECGCGEITENRV